MRSTSAATPPTHNSEPSSETTSANSDSTSTCSSKATGRQCDGATGREGNKEAASAPSHLLISPSPRRLVAPSHLRRLRRLIADQTMSAVVCARAPTHNPPKPPHKYRLSVSLKSVNRSALIAPTSPCHVVCATLM